MTTEIKSVQTPPAMVPLSRIKLRDGRTVVILSKMGYVNSVNMFEAVDDATNMISVVFENEAQELIDRDIRRSMRFTVEIDGEKDDDCTNNL